jgi:fatty acyl-CoA reductase
VESKLIPIEGDITKDGLDLQPEVRQMLIENCEVIINCAASIDFNERLCDAL